MAWHGAGRADISDKGTSALGKGRGQTSRSLLPVLRDGGASYSIAKPYFHCRTVALENILTVSFRPGDRCIPANPDPSARSRPKPRLRLPTGPVEGFVDCLGPEPSQQPKAHDSHNQTQQAQPRGSVADGHKPSQQCHRTRALRLIPARGSGGNSPLERALVRPRQRREPVTRMRTWLLVVS